MVEESPGGELHLLEMYLLLPPQVYPDHPTNKHINWPITTKKNKIAYQQL